MPTSRKPRSDSVSSAVSAATRDASFHWPKQVPLPSDKADRQTALDIAEALAGDLDVQGITTAIRFAITTASLAQVQLNQLQADIDSEGMTVVNNRGTVTQSPLVNLQEIALRRYLAALKVIGQSTPADKRTLQRRGQAQREIREDMDLDRGDGLLA